jgi:hypothetical protein
MKQLSALSLSIGILGGIATWAFLTVGGLLIWAAFVAWGCFFHTGGDANALRGTIINNIFGVVIATVAALVILTVPGADALGLPLWAGIVVGVTAGLICITANIKVFSVIPAGFYGYACTFAFLLQTPDKLSVAALTAPSWPKENEQSVAFRTRSGDVKQCQGFGSCGSPIMTSEALITA